MALVSVHVPCNGAGGMSIAYREKGIRRRGEKVGAKSRLLMEVDLSQFLIRVRLRPWPESKKI